MENNILIDDLNSIYIEYGNIQVLAYYKLEKGKKIYYDFQSQNDPKLKGFFDKLPVLELVYYLQEQSHIL